MEISNNTLAWLVIAAVIVSIGGTIMSLAILNGNGITGYATSNATGNVSISLATQTSLIFAVPAVALGSGSVDATSYNNCTIYVNLSTGTTQNRSAGCQGFDAAISGPLILENNGNSIINVTLNFSTNATAFIGGGGTGVLPEFQYSVQQNETSSCTSINTTLSNFTNVTANQIVPICTNLNWQNTQDTLAIGIYLVIPVDAAEGSKQVNITAQGTG